MKVVNGCIPVLTVSSIEQARSLYVDVLGFSVDFEFSPDGAGQGSVTKFVGLLHGDVMIHVIEESSDKARQPAGSGNISLFVDEIDELFTSCRRNGVTVIVEPGDRVYGQRDFAIRDDDGNVLTFGCEIRG